MELNFNLTEKEEEKQEILKEKISNKNGVIGFSGGIDSSGLIIALKELGMQYIQPVFIDRDQVALDWERKASQRIWEEFLYPKYKILKPLNMTIKSPSPELREIASNNEQFFQYFARNSDIFNVLARVALGISTRENNFSIIAIGSVKESEFRPMDTTQEFADIKQREFEYLEKKLEVLVPFDYLKMDKLRAWEYVVSLNPSWNDHWINTRSCWENYNNPCNKITCKPCVDRLRIRHRSHIISGETPEEFMNPKELDLLLRIPIK